MLGDSQLGHSYVVSTREQGLERSGFCLHFGLSSPPPFLAMVPLSPLPSRHHSLLQQWPKWTRSALSGILLG